MISGAITFAITLGDTPVGSLQFFAHFFEDTFKFSPVIYDDDCTHNECEDDFFHE